MIVSLYFIIVSSCFFCFGETRNRRHESRVRSQCQHCHDSLFFGYVFIISFCWGYSVRRLSVCFVCGFPVEHVTCYRLGYVSLLLLYLFGLFVIVCCFGLQKRSALLRALRTCRRLPKNLAYTTGALA